MSLNFLFLMSFLFSFFWSWYSFFENKLEEINMDNKSFKEIPDTIFFDDMATIKSPYASDQEKIRAKNNIKNNFIAFVLTPFLYVLLALPFFVFDNLMLSFLGFVIALMIYKFFDIIFLESYVRKAHDLAKPLEEKLLKNICENNRKKEDEGTVYNRESSLLKWFFKNFDNPEYVKYSRDTGLEDEYLEKAFCQAYEETLASALKIKSIDLFNDFFNYYYNGLEVDYERLQVMNWLLVEVSDLYKITKFYKYKALSDLAKSILDYGSENEFPYVSVWKDMPNNSEKKKVIVEFLDERALDMEVRKILTLKLKSKADVEKIFAFGIDVELKRKETAEAVEKSYERKIAEAGYEPVEFTQSELEQLGKVDDNSKKELYTESKNKDNQ